MTFAEIARRASKFAIDNSPTIITTLGVVGSITTAILAGKASYEAAGVIHLKEADDEYRNIPPPEDPKELLKSRVLLVWKLYIPAASVGAVTLACIIAANRIGNRRAAGLAAAYTLIEKSSSEYRDKVIEKIGERKEEAIYADIAKDRVAASHREGVEIVGGTIGELCYDMFLDRYFWSSVEKIRSAVNDFNHEIIHNGYASLAEFYHFLEIPAPPVSESIGWNSDELLQVRTDATLTLTNKPCITMGFKNDPSPNYGRFR